MRNSLCCIAHRVPGHRARVATAAAAGKRPLERAGESVPDRVGPRQDDLWNRPGLADIGAYSRIPSCQRAAQAGRRQLATRFDQGPVPQVDYGGPVVIGPAATASGGEGALRATVLRSPAEAMILSA